MTRMPALLSTLVLATPLLVAAQTQTVANIVGVFNVFVGLMLTVALLVYFFGFVLWWTRLGTWPTYRTEAVKVMEWSVAILFSLVVILGIVQFFQRHQQAAGYVISALVIIGIMWFISTIVKEPSEEKAGGHGGHE